MGDETALNPGPIEEVGKVATTFIGSFRESPTILAMSVFNILFLGFVLWSTIEERSWREQVVTMMVEQQAAGARMLNACIPVDKIQEFLRALRPAGDDGKTP
jgi:uncharacterized membrane protein affecting hemolysin expression